MTTKLNLPKFVGGIYTFAIRSTQCHLDNSYIDVNSKDDKGNVSDTVRFNVSDGRVYSPEFRLVGDTREDIEAYLKEFCLPAPSVYIDKDTPEDDKYLVEALKNAYEEVREISDDEEVGSLTVLNIGQSTKPLNSKIKTPTFSKLYNSDKEVFKDVNVKLGISKAPKNKDAVVTKSSTKSIEKKSEAKTSVRKTPAKVVKAKTATTSKAPTRSRRVKVEPKVEEVEDTESQDVEEVESVETQDVESETESVEEESQEETEKTTKPTVRKIGVLPRKITRLSKAPAEDDGESEDAPKETPRRTVTRRVISRRKQL